MLPLASAIHFISMAPRYFFSLKLRHQRPELAFALESLFTIILVAVLAFDAFLINHDVLPDERIDLYMIGLIHSMMIHSLDS